MPAAVTQTQGALLNLIKDSTDRLRRSSARIAAPQWDRSRILKATDRKRRQLGDAVRRMIGVHPDRITLSHLRRPFLDGWPAEMHAVLWQHPVGQGLFHSGSIQFGRGPDFRYVYDCGKLPSANWSRVLGPTLTAYGLRPLDALFISHFDRDHINGLGELLRTFEGAKRTFLPYLSPARRLVLAAGDAERGNSPDAEHIEFIDDPAGWLFRRGVDEVIFVGGAGPSADPDNQRTPQRLPFPGDQPNAPAQIGLPVLRYESSTQPPTGMEVEPHDEPQVRPGPPSGRTSRAPFYMDHCVPIVLHTNERRSFCWIFQTYVDPDPETAAAVRGVVLQVLHHRYSDLTNGDLRCGEILSSDILRKRLAKAYREATQIPELRWRDIVFSNARKRAADRSRMNRTTMSLFSGPLADPNSQKALNVFHSIEGDASQVFPGQWHLSAEGRNGWLLLGDAVLADQDILERLLLFFGADSTNYLAQTLAFTTPHHGSARNFSRETLRRLGVPPIAIVPAGDKTHYAHPSDDVIELLRDHGVQVAHVHEKRELGFVHHIAGVKSY